MVGTGKIQNEGLRLVIGKLKWASYESEDEVLK